jgi:hypothetical protein
MSAFFQPFNTAPVTRKLYCAMHGDSLQHLFQAREAYLRQIGTVDVQVLTPLLGQAFTGGPPWPSSRQGWSVVRNGPRTILLSDGLSDPFAGEDGPNTGFGIEVVGETADALDERLEWSWLYAVINEVSQQAAAYGVFRRGIDELGLLSMEIEAMTDELAALAGPGGKVGLLLGLQPPGWPMEWHLPGGLVKLVTVKLLQPAELAFVVERGKAGREHLRDLFASDGSYHLSSLSRPSVVGEGK